MNFRWIVCKVNNLTCPDCLEDHCSTWRVWDSEGAWDSDWADWAAAVDWAASPCYRLECYANGVVL